VPLDETGGRRLRLGPRPVAGRQNSFAARGPGQQKAAQELHVATAWSNSQWARERAVSPGSPLMTHARALSASLGSRGLQPDSIQRGTPPPPPKEERGWSSRHLNRHWRVPVSATLVPFRRRNLQLHFEWLLVRLVKRKSTKPVVCRRSSPCSFVAWCYPLSSWNV